MPFLGYISDIAPSHILIPLSFGIRGLSVVLFMYVERPDSFACKLIVVLFGIGTPMEFISVDVLFMRTLPKDVRGAMLGAFAFFGQIGSLIFTQVGGHLFDTVGPKSPFAVVAIADILFFTLSTILACCGYLRLT